MFLESSRYFNQKTIDVRTKTGRQIKAVKLRRLPKIAGSSIMLKGEDRLDIISYRQYGDATRFWHIADANTKMEARELVRKPGQEINIPQQ